MALLTLITMTFVLIITLIMKQVNGDDKQITVHNDDVDGA